MIPKLALNEYELNLISFKRGKRNPLFLKVGLCNLPLTDLGFSPVSIRNERSYLASQHTPTPSKTCALNVDYIYMSGWLFVFRGQLR